MRAHASVGGEWVFVCVFFLLSLSLSLSLSLWHYPDAQMGSPLVAVAWRYVRPRGAAIHKRIDSDSGNGYHANDKAQHNLKEPLEADDSALDQDVKRGQGHLNAGAMQPGETTRAQAGKKKRSDGRGRHLYRQQQQRNKGRARVTLLCSASVQHRLNALGKARSHAHRHEALESLLQLAKAVVFQLAVDPTADRPGVADVAQQRARKDLWRVVRQRKAQGAKGFRREARALVLDAPGKVAQALSPFEDEGALQAGQDLLGQDAPESKEVLGAVAARRALVEHIARVVLLLLLLLAAIAVVARQLLELADEVVGVL